VLVFDAENFEAPLVLLGFTMWCDAISAVTEFMARVLHSRSVVGIHDVV
jgi:hypothetical protein